MCGFFFPIEPLEGIAAPDRDSLLGVEGLSREPLIPAAEPEEFNPDDGPFAAGVFPETCIFPAWWWSLGVVDPSKPLSSLPLFPVCDSDSLFLSIISILRQLEMWYYLIYLKSTN